MDKKLAFEPHKVKGIHPLGDTVIVHNMSFDVRLSYGGIILPQDDMKSSGIRPRWAQIYAVGPEQKDPELVVGKWILISHGRWTRGIKIDDGTGEQVIRKVDTNDILMISDEQVYDHTMSDKV